MAAGNVEHMPMPINLVVDRTAKMLGVRGVAILGDIGSAIDRWYSCYAGLYVWRARANRCG